jgi:hypothetical protein
MLARAEHRRAARPSTPRCSNATSRHGAAGPVVRRHRRELPVSCVLPQERITRAARTGPAVQARRRTAAARICPADKGIRRAITRLWEPWMQWAYGAGYDRNPRRPCLHAGLHHRGGPLRGRRTHQIHPRHAEGLSPTTHASCPPRASIPQSFPRLLEALALQPRGPRKVSVQPSRSWHRSRACAGRPMRSAGRGRPLRDGPPAPAPSRRWPAQPRIVSSVHSQWNWTPSAWASTAMA